MYFFFYISSKWFGYGGKLMNNLIMFDFNIGSKDKTENTINWGVSQHRIAKRKIFVITPFLCVTRTVWWILTGLCECLDRIKCGVSPTPTLSMCIIRDYYVHSRFEFLCLLYMRIGILHRESYHCSVLYLFWNDFNLYMCSFQTFLLRSSLHILFQ